MTGRPLKYSPQWYKETEYLEWVAGDNSKGDYPFPVHPVDLTLAIQLLARRVLELENR